MKLKLLVLTCMVLLCMACEKMSANQGQTDYDKLCTIYEEIVQQSIEAEAKEIKLVVEIEKQLPVFFKQHYVHLINTARNRTYGLIKQVAESNNVKDWECPVMKTYYEGGYDK